MEENGQQTSVEPVRDEAMPTPPGVATPQQMKLMKQWFRDMIDLGRGGVVHHHVSLPAGEGAGYEHAPRLDDQDRLFINKFAYRIGDVKRGDVVVFLYPGDHTKSYIKRVIGLPGDDVRVDHGHVYVNGAELAEPYVAEQIRRRPVYAGDWWCRRARCL